jgi:hypothetical protein
MFWYRKTKWRGSKSCRCGCSRCVRPSAILARKPARSCSLRKPIYLHLTPNSRTNLVLFQIITERRPLYTRPQRYSSLRSGHWRPSQPTAQTIAMEIQRRNSNQSTTRLLHQNTILHTVFRSLPENYCKEAFRNASASNCPPPLPPSRRHAESSQNRAGVRGPLRDHVK